METCPDHTHICERLINIEKGMTEIHLALIGNLEKPGFIRDTKERIDKVQGRQDLLMRLGGWTAGIFGAGFAVVIGDWLLHIIK
jgi:hypothetical protein